MRSATLWIVALATVLTGCAGHASTMKDVRDALIRNDLDEARARLADAGGGTDDLLFALEDGLLLHYVGEAELSNDRLEFAEREVEDRYTKSITRAALSLLTSDLALAFDPNGIENFLINYYKALNYLELGEPQDAWVEWRRLSQKLQFSREHGEDVRLDPPFFNYVAGLGIESDDRNAAYINYRLAEAAYRKDGRRPPPQLLADLVRVGARLGFADHVEEYRARYELATFSEDEYLAGDGFGTRTGELSEVILLVEEGLVAPIEEVRAYLPITKERAKHVEGDGNLTHLDLAEALAVEYHQGQYHGVRPSYAKRVEIAYVLPVALPVFGRGRPAFRRVSAIAAERRADAIPVLDVSELQKDAFADRLLGIYAKTIARALIKYLAAEKLKEEAKDEGGEDAEEVVGVLANLVNVVTERADTRAWLGLPHRIWIARLALPPGAHEITIDLDDTHELSLGRIELAPGERRFLSHRVF